jgi:hypothetical protein
VSPTVFTSGTVIKPRFQRMSPTSTSLQRNGTSHRLSCYTLGQVLRNRGESAEADALQKRWAAINAAQQVAPR